MKLRRLNNIAVTHDFLNWKSHFIVVLRIPQWIRYKMYCLLIISFIYFPPSCYHNHKFIMNINPYCKKQHQVTYKTMGRKNFLCVIVSGTWVACKTSIVTYIKLWVKHVQGLMYDTRVFFLPNNKIINVHNVGNQMSSHVEQL